MKNFKKKDKKYNMKLDKEICASCKWYFRGEDYSDCIKNNHSISPINNCDEWKKK